MAALTVAMSVASDDVLRAREELLNKMEQMTKSQVQWQDIGAPAYRKARREGTHGFPTPVFNPDAALATCKARDGHQINLRVIKPATETSKGVLLHFHAGGFVIGSSMSYDTYLTKLANGLSMSVASVEYRLAPEHQYPTAQQDCVDAALFALSAEGESQLGAPLKVLRGESAGGYLAVWTALSLLHDYNIDVRAKIDAVVASCGVYDATYTPSMLSHDRDIIVSKEGMARFMETAFGNVPFADRKQAKVSPLYADTSNMPRGLFLCGAVDPLVDDSTFMATRWSLSGNHTVLRIVPAACHAFTLFGLGEVSDEGVNEILDFIKGPK